MQQWQDIVSHISSSTGRDFQVARVQAAGGGSINSASVLEAEDGRRCFVKTNRSGMQAMFAAEARGLQAMAESRSLRVPQVICHGDDGRCSYIVLEYLELSGRPDQRLLGEQLAAMHRHGADAFGWDIDNTIGSTPQANAWSADWLDFWRQRRLGFQLQLAAEKGYGGELQRLGEKLLADMNRLFDGHDPQPSMLHGDLWGGNVAGLADGTPVIYDPAFYYGDREADIAMTYVFGGFSRDFYDAYEAAWPLHEGFALRKTFYNLYHIINHLNLFGGAYLGQAVNMLRQLLSEI